MRRMEWSEFRVSISVCSDALIHSMHTEKLFCMGLFQRLNANLFSAANKGSASGGHATEGKDSAGGAAKAKKEFPEAPDPAIGMQDERGGRGG
jgi:hypothetical protein